MFKCDIYQSIALNTEAARFGRCAHRIRVICARNTLCGVDLDNEMCIRVLAGTEAEANFSLLVTEKMYHRDIKYCSNERCSLPFDWCGDETSNYSDASIVSCPMCRICGTCRTAWHPGRKCVQHKSIEEDMDVFGDFELEMNWMP